MKQNPTRTPSHTFLTTPFRPTQCTRAQLNTICHDPKSFTNQTRAKMTRPTDKQTDRQTDCWLTAADRLTADWPTDSTSLGIFFPFFPSRRVSVRFVTRSDHLVGCLLNEISFCGCGFGHLRPLLRTFRPFLFTSVTLLSLCNVCTVERLNAMTKATEPDR